MIRFSAIILLAAFTAGCSSTRTVGLMFISNDLTSILVSVDSLLEDDLDATLEVSPGQREFVQWTETFDVGPWTDTPPFAIPPLEITATDDRRTILWSEGIFGIPTWDPLAKETYYLDSLESYNAERAGIEKPEERPHAADRTSYRNSSVYIIRINRSGMRWSY